MYIETAVPPEEKEFYVPFSDGAPFQEQFQDLVLKLLTNCVSVSKKVDSETAVCVEETMMWQWGLKARKQPKVWMEQTQPGTADPEPTIYSFRLSYAARLKSARSDWLYKKQRQSILGMPNTMWQCGKLAATSSRNHSPNSITRF